MKEYIHYLFDDVPLECRDSYGRFTIKPGIRKVKDYRSFIENLMKTYDTNGDYGYTENHYVVICVWNTGSINWGLKVGYNFEVLN